MGTTRVIIETQSNPLFIGIESEQDFDQRGGLCEVGTGHVVVTTRPIDPDYLNYWQGLGFSLPTLICAGPFDPACAITDLIVRNHLVQSEIKNAVNGSVSRIEPFWTEKSDLALSEALGIPIYSNIDLSSELACKFSFKKMCDALLLPTAPWVGGHSVSEIIDAYRTSAFADKPVLAKAANCTGGIDLGAMIKFSSVADLENRKKELDQLRFPLVVEEILPSVREAGVHWEIDENNQMHFVGIFDQLSQNFSYSGAAFPSTLPVSVKNQISTDLSECFFPELKKRNARGFFCCDVLVDSFDNIFWTDFNPRKGAILYVFHMTERLAQEVLGLSQNPWYVWHQHTHLPLKKCSFIQVQKALGHLLEPSTTKPFVVLTNPGSIPYGGIDITGMSVRSRTEASQIVREAQKVLQCTLG